jgi:hypothetical protein
MLGAAAVAAFMMTALSCGKEDCAVGEESCSCTPGGQCNPGLTCASQLCVKPDGPMGRGGTSPASSTADASQLCSSACARLVGCDPSKDQQTCRNDCLNASLLRFSRLRPDILGDANGCITRKDCATVLSGVSRATESCIEEAGAARAPSAATVDMCGKLEAALQKCGGGVDRASCYTVLKVYNDNVIREAAACTEKACTAIRDCFNSVVGYRALK